MNNKFKGIQLTMSLKGFNIPQTFSLGTLIPSSSRASRSAVATTSLSDGSLFPPAKLQKKQKTRTTLITSRIFFFKVASSGL